MVDSVVVLQSKQKITEGYVVYSAINNKNPSKVAIALSTNEVVLYDIHSNAKVVHKEHAKSVSALKFSQKSPNLLFSSSLDGKILVWDGRSGKKPVQTFLDNSDNDLKPIVCFDFNYEEKLICAGTELIREDAFIVFWDSRTATNLGGYWNSHTDEITQVQFHSSHSTELASSSVDGLINFYDLSESSENEALFNTLNAEDSVNKFCWHDEFVSCITGSEEFQYWSTDEVKPLVSMNREKFCNGSLIDVDYLIDAFASPNDHIIAAGNNKGSMYLYKCRGSKMQKVAQLTDGHTDVVRTANYCQKENFMLSGGEDGTICVWKASL